MSLLVAYITGLADDKDGPLLGMRDYFTSIGVTPLTGAWNDLQSLAKIVEEMSNHGHVLLMGHSHGGDRAIEIADGHFGAVPPIDWLIALDPKPRLFGEVTEWIDSNYDYPIPRYAAYCTSFYGGFGRPFATIPITENVKESDPLVIPEGKSVLNVEMPERYRGLIGHPRIPGSAIVQNFIGERVKDLQAI